MMMMEAASQCHSRMGRSRKKSEQSSFDFGSIRAGVVGSSMAVGRSMVEVVEKQC